ncbi:uncharacterized protein LOC128626007 [Artibeus jamaicensis]|uniref:uncharacterized protein LOC128626007 n=1 Tax=Artibeus jamaicensis TaxID=9417 RepID=UPI00235AB765|nr:uncharacterized protein LOC128626007 [Artibeus jamaicensis]
MYPSPPVIYTTGSTRTPFLREAAGINFSCAYCKEKGHWKWDCPKIGGASKGPKHGPEVLLQTLDRRGQGSIPVGSQEPMVTLTVEGKQIDFLVDTGATYSVLKQPRGQIQKATTKIVGAMGEAEAYPWTTARITDLGRGTITHSFLVIPDCPYPLLGRDLLQKLQATITFKQQEDPVAGASMEVTVPFSEEYLLAALQEERRGDARVSEALQSKI